MNKAELETQIESDLSIDKTNLEYEAAQNPVLHFRYIRLLQEAKLKLKILENRLKLVKSNRFKYYIGKHPDEVCDTVYEKSEVKLVLDGDKDVLKVEAEIFVQNSIVELLEQTCDVFKSRGFAIKHIIDVRRLEAGL